MRKNSQTMEKMLASYKVTLIRLTKVRIKNLKMALNKIKAMMTRKTTILK